ncbi:MAG TPA: NAD-dependent epimerase/dehydratase family protein [Candidatus Saccharimonadales bacterium]|nr:NAD-dependent epimerase/dehydratase family protein [Candidatus Saccharimonadales bacterium]
MINSIIEQDVNGIIEANPELIEQLEGKSFLVTGATGMIGRYAVCLLAEAARRNGSGSVIAHVRNQAKAEQMFATYSDDPSLTLLVSDIQDLTELDDNVDYILHAASPTQPQDFTERPVDIIKANVFATANLLEIAKQKGARFCLLSTLEIYGQVEAPTYPVSVAESDFGALDSLDLRSAYPESKRLAENLCVAYQKQFNVASTIVRVAPVISPAIEDNDKRVFAQFIHDVTDNKDITVYSDAASKRRSYTYIADAVSGIFTALLRSTNDNFVFNLANNDNVASIQELAEKIIAASPESTAKLNVVERQADQNTSSSTGLVLLNSQRLLDLGWRPAYSLEAGIKQVVKCSSAKE